MHFRLTQKLAKKIKEPVPLQSLEKHPDPLCDWTANLFTVGRTQYVILCHTTTLYSCLFPGAGITDDERFLKAAFEAIRESMADEGLEKVYFKRLAPTMSSVFFGKSLNRSVTGSVTEQVHAAKSLLEERELTLYETAQRINENPLSFLGEDDRYGEPRDAFLKLCGVGGFKEPAPPKELPPNVIPFERPRRDQSGRSTAEKRWQQFAKSFDVSRGLIRDGRLPADFFPEHMMDLRKSSVPVEARPVIQFLLHVWDPNGYPFELSNVIGWSDENLSAFGLWATGQTLRGACRYFN